MADPKCPGCDGQGVFTDDPQVLRCANCRGVFTSGVITQEQAIKFVRFQLPMLANAGADGAFFFDFMIGRDDDSVLPAQRVHGWADTKTKRVVQFG